MRAPVVQDGRAGAKGLPKGRGIGRDGPQWLSRPFLNEVTLVGRCGDRGARGDQVLKLAAVPDRGRCLVAVLPEPFRRKEHGPDVDPDGRREEEDRKLQDAVLLLGVR